MTMWDGIPGFWLLLALVWVLVSIGLVVLIVLAVVWLARSVGSGGGARTRGAPGSPTGAATGSATGSAREALDLRYARGEISRDDYLQARRDIGEPLD